MRFTISASLAVALPRWLRTKRIEGCDAGGLKIRNVAGRDGQAVLKGGRCHSQIEVLIANLLRQTAPATRYRDVDRKNSTLIGAQDRIDAGCKTRCEWRIELPPFDPALDFADRDHADKEVLGREPLDPVG
jgi:hypothetical protein